MATLTVFAVDFIRPKSVAEMVGLFLLLLVPIGMGWATALRTQVLQRQQYAQWRQSQQINEALAREIEERTRLQEALVKQATTDPLTGLNNRRQYETLFAMELARSKRKGNALSLCIIDLDHFKQINDSYGHSAGDSVLKGVAQLCRQSFRTIDILGRLGGEEFVVLLPDTDLSTSAHIARRFVASLAATPILIGDESIHVTATIGVVERLADEDQLESLVQRADKALYEGKRGGRNQVRTG